MSTWAGVDLGEYSIEEWQNTYHKWLFNDSDRVREENDEPFIGFRMDAATLERRLELQGVNRHSVQKDINEVKALWIKDMKGILDEDITSERSIQFLRYINGLQNCSLESWLKLIPIAKSYPIPELVNFQVYIRDLPKEITEPLTEAEQNLLEFMCSDYDVYPHYTFGAYYFPCNSSYSFAWAILQILKPDVVCELDISGLISSGWVDDFEDLAERQAGQTKFFNRAKAEVQDIANLSKSDETNPVLQRLSYSGLVTILEAYLSDIAKRQVLNKDSIKRRFVEKFEPFASGQKQLKVTEIYSRLEQLDTDIIECIDGLSFHSLKTIKDFFPSVLLVNISSDISKRLAQAVNTRHDIVHRAGRTKDGKVNDVTQADVQSVSILVLEVMSSIDYQIVDGLLEVN